MVEGLDSRQDFTFTRFAIPLKIFSIALAVM